MITRNSIILTLAIFLSAHTAVASPPPTPDVMKILCQSITANGSSEWKKDISERPITTFYKDSQIKSDGSGRFQDVRFTIVKEGGDVTIFCFNRLSGVSSKKSKEEAELYVAVLNGTKGLFYDSLATSFNDKPDTESNNVAVLSDEYTTCSVSLDFRFDEERERVIDIISYFGKTTMPHAEYMKWLQS